jgi:ubiquitin carboxyl-terminal hydrolase 7
MDHYKLEADQFRLWTVLYRQNKTIRVDQPLSVQEDRSGKKQIVHFFF